MSDSTPAPQKDAIAQAKTARLSARVTPGVRKTIDTAASLVGATTNQFVVQAAYQAAQRLIEQETVIRLSERDTSTLLDLLENPPAPNKKLTAAVAAYRQSSLYAEG